MPVYRNAQHLQDVLAAMVDQVQSGEAAQGLRRAGLVVAFVYHDPEITVLIDGRTPAPEGVYMTVKFHDLTPPPDVTFTCSADIGHQFWQGQLNVPMALARGQVKARGAVAKALKLLPLLPPLHAAYRAVLHRRGEEHLLAVP